MTRIKSILWFAVFVLILVSCREAPIDKYTRPDWLAGKVYTQILEQPALSTFARGIELTGYDTIINESGSYTVFAPSNEAFDAYFASNPNYSSIEQMSISELSRMVKFHIIINPWSKVQLRSLDVDGWIDLNDPENNKPRGFKRETLLLDKDVKYGVRNVRVTGTTERRDIIVDTTESNWHRRVITDSRKYAPFFFQEYFDIYDLKSSDYEFYFDRTFEGSNEIYFANAKIISEEIDAENGFVYILDQVVEPFKNAYQFLSEDEDHKYSDFLDLVNLFSLFEYNEDKTFDQLGADQGLAVDSLFDVSYPELAFDITKENTEDASGTSGLPENVSIRFHNGLMAPTNEALAQFEQEYFQIPMGWGSLAQAPIRLKRIVANTYMSNNPIYKTDLEEGFYNGELDIVKIDQSAILQKGYGSNTTFFGLNKAVVPRAFSSVAGPVYLQRGYVKVMYAIEQSGLLPALKRPDNNYMFFVESDNNTYNDSSLIYDPGSGRFSTFETSEGDYTEYSLSTEDLRTLLLNHIAVDQPRGNARKEFIKNLAGNYIIIDNESGEMSGTGPTTHGYQGTDQIPNFPSVISLNSDNGLTYDIKNWFSFSTATLFNIISSQYQKFHSLLVKAGLSTQYEYNFISEGELYSVFIPSDAALDSAQVDTLAKTDLKNLLMLHFVKGGLIFTDGRSDPGYYKTSRVDEKSTQFTKLNTEIYIEPGIDLIRILDKSGGTYLELSESEANNKLAAINKGEGEEVFSILQNNAVIHQIDKVLLVNELNTN
ncbi:fasciclin domain-containing protein [Bacteroidota bacterium]